jgi:hypothetical protein
MSRKNEHPSCNCWACKRGRHTGSGHFIIKQVNKKIRRLYREMLRADVNRAEQIIVGTPYTD